MTTKDTSIEECVSTLVNSSQKILEIGCGTGRFRQWLDQRDTAGDPTGAAHCTLEEVHISDLTSEFLSQKSHAFDTVLIFDDLAPLSKLEWIFRSLRKHLKPGTRFFVVASNISHVSQIERLLMGDYQASNEDERPLSAKRRFTLSSLSRTLLNNGWMPDLTAYDAFLYENTELIEGLISAAAAAGVPSAVAKRNLLVDRMMFECTASPRPQNAGQVSLSVIVPVNNEVQFQLNTNNSPGLEEIDAEVIHVLNAPNAAVAFSSGLAQASNEWIMFCHQDVYVPKDSGHILAELLEKIPVERRKDVLIGFAGLCRDKKTKALLPAGLVTDRLKNFDHSAQHPVVSLDEFAVIMHKDTVHRLDPQFGWHLWATDLCLQAENRETTFVGIARIPIFHNSLNDHVLSDSFYESENVLKAKYPDHRDLGTLCRTPIEND